MTKNDKTSHPAQSTSPTLGPSLSQITSTLSFDPTSSHNVASDASPPHVSDDAPFLKAPPKQHFTQPPQSLIIGAGSRGTSYAQSALSSSNAVIAAVCEPIESKRLAFGNAFIWGDVGVPRFGACFSDWREWVSYEKERRESARTGKGLTGDGGFAPIVIDVIFVCVLDEMHEEVLCGVAGLGVHVCVEKPLSTSLQSCGRIYRALKSVGESRAGSEEGTLKETVFGICHVLRYSPHNMMLRHLVLDKEVTK
jgi:hypothetical protein